MYPSGTTGCAPFYIFLYVWPRFMFRIILTELPHRPQLFKSYLSSVSHARRNKHTASAASKLLSMPYKAQRIPKQKLIISSPSFSHPTLIPKSSDLTHCFSTMHFIKLQSVVTLALLSSAMMAMASPIPQGFFVRLSYGLSLWRSC